MTSTTMNLVHAIQKTAQLIHYSMPTPNVQDVRTYRQLLSTYNQVSPAKLYANEEFEKASLTAMASTTELAIINAESLQLLTMSS